MKCPYCQSENIEEGIIVQNRIDTTKEIGLMYRKNQFTYDFKPFYVDVCLDCGTITRTYVKGDIKNKKWEKELWNIF